MKAFTSECSCLHVLTVVSDLNRFITHPWARDQGAWPFIHHKCLTQTIDFAVSEFSFLSSAVSVYHKAGRCIVYIRMKVKMFSQCNWSLHDCWSKSISAAWVLHRNISFMMEVRGEHADCFQLTPRLISTLYNRGELKSSSTFWTFTWMSCNSSSTHCFAYSLKRTQKRYYFVHVKDFNWISGEYFSFKAREKKMPTWIFLMRADVSLNAPWLISF